MQMIDVLKRLAELDAENPNVTATMLPEQSLATMSNIDGEMIAESFAPVEECGGMGMGAMPPHTPASIHVTANSGQEVSDMLKSLMTLAGVDKPNSSAGYHEIEFGAPHAVEPADDMAGILGMVDKMNGGSEKEIDIVGDEGDNELSSEPDEKEESWDNSPDPEIEPHDYGDKQVPPKPQGLKQRLGDNPYKPTQESVDEIAAKLLDEYRQFVGESSVTELSKGTKWKYTDLGRKSASDLANKASDADDSDTANKLIGKALKRQNKVRKVEKDLVGENSLDDMRNLAGLNKR